MALASFDELQAHVDAAIGPTLFVVSSSRRGGAPLPSRRAVTIRTPGVWIVGNGGGDGTTNNNKPLQVNCTQSDAGLLRVLADVLRVVSTVLQPVMPASMARMLDQLGVPADARDLAALDTPLAEGTILPPPQGVFPRYVEEAS